MKHLTRGSRITLGNGCNLRSLALRVYTFSVLPRYFGQASTSAANQSGVLGNGEASVERPVGKLPRRRSITTQSVRAHVFERVGHDGFQNSGSSHQRNLIVAFSQGSPAIGIGLLEYRPKFGIVNEFEPARWRRGGRSGRNRLIVRPCKRSDSLSQNAEQLLSEFGRSCACDGTAIRG